MESKAEHYFQRFAHQPFTGIAFVDEVTEFCFGHPPIDAKQANHANERCALIFPDAESVLFLQQPAGEHLPGKKFCAFFIPDNFHGLGKVVFQAAVIVLDEVVEGLSLVLPEAPGYGAGGDEGRVNIE